MEFSLDIMIQYSFVNHHKQRHGEHWDVTTAPGKPDRHQPYFESRAHTDFVCEQPALEGPRRPVTAEEALEPGPQQQPPGKVVLSIISIYFTTRR